MLTGLWNYLAGYVIIELEGKALERFLNRLLSEGVEIWHVRRTKQGTVTAYISVSGFYMLHSMVRGQHIKVHILQKHGLIMHLSRLRFRKVLLYGWIVVVLLLLAASRRIWFIEITGLDTVSREDVLSILEENGIKEGVWRSAAHTAPLGNSIMASDPRVAWAGVTLNGVNLCVDIIEAGDPASVPQSEPLPASIYAAADGVVSSLTVIEGKPLVRQGDAVRAGQELISGVLGKGEDNTVFVHARGTVIAKCLRRFTSSKGPTLTMDAPAEEPLYETRITVFGKEIRSGIPFEKTQERVLFKSALTNCFIPVTVETIAVYPTEKRTVAPGETLLREAALREAERMMAESLPKDARILSKESETVLLEDGSIQAAITVITEENIAITKEFDAPYGKQPH